jgi:hypothetical protein
MNTNPSVRRFDLDWLRVSAILIVFLYHSTRFFNLEDWHVKNVDTFVWVEIWNIFATRWMMPLFFIISGASLFYALEKSDGWRKFYTGKMLRLMIPVIIGAVTHSALQIYLERLSHGQFSGSFFSFFPEYFNGLYLDIGMPGNFAFHGMHLWYLLFLFIYSLICYRLFLWLKSGGRDLLRRLTSLLTIPGVMVLGFSLPLLIMRAILPTAVLEAGSGGWGFLYYLWFLVSGFIIMSSRRLQDSIMDQRWLSLLMGIGLSVILLYQLFSPARFIFSTWLSSLILPLLSFFSAWCWLLAILGFGMRFLTFERSWLPAVNEGIMPFYILHQTVLLCIGYFVVTWEMNAAIKWGIVFISAFMAIIALVLIIRKIEVFRFLFGMKTTQPFFEIFQTRKAVLLLLGFYVGLIVFAAVNMGRAHAPMPLTYDSTRDILLNAESITGRSKTGVRVINDPSASKGRAIEFVSGANERTEPQPTVYVEMRFSAPTGQYMVWLRGKTDVNSGYTDSVWVQVDDQIGTRKSARMGNWLDVHPAGVYGWAGDTDDPVSIMLKHDGDHIIRIQPRQTPHRIDQIWLSRSQPRIPDTPRPIK